MASSIAPIIRPRPATWFDAQRAPSGLSLAAGKRLLSQQQLLAKEGGGIEATANLSQFLAQRANIKRPRNLPVWQQEVFFNSTNNSENNDEATVRYHVPHGYEGRLRWSVIAVSPHATGSLSQDLLVRDRLGLQVSGPHCISDWVTNATSGS